MDTSSSSSTVRLDSLSSEFTYVPHPFIKVGASRAADTFVRAAKKHQCNSEADYAPSLRCALRVPGWITRTGDHLHPRPPLIATTTQRQGGRARRPSVLPFGRSDSAADPPYDTLSRA